MWILARLHQLVQEVTDHMDKYDTVKASRPIKDFIDELSTWYVRRSRDRFKGDDEVDKQNAISTLREVLLTLSKVMAPFTPFISEKIYLQLSTNNDQQTTSVHLEMWPEVDKKLIDEKLLTEMKQVRKIVELGLFARKDAGIRVRQPLQYIRYQGVELSEDLEKVIAEEMNVREVKFTDKIEDKDGRVIKEDGDLKIALNIDLTDELTKEGLMREVVRAINQMRKEQKLTRDHRVKIKYSSSDSLLQSAITEYNDEIMQSVLADSIETGVDGKEVDLGECKIKLLVEKLV